MQTSIPAGSPRPLRIKLGLRTWKDDIAFLGANLAVSEALRSTSRNVDRARTVRAAHHARRVEAIKSRVLGAQ